MTPNVASVQQANSSADTSSNSSQAGNSTSTPSPDQAVESKDTSSTSHQKEQTNAADKNSAAPLDFPQYSSRIQQTEATKPSTIQKADIRDTLRISSLYKNFGKKRVVQGIDFSMQTGEVLGLLGPNGSGKTTTFYMIVGFYKPTSGEVFMNDQRITTYPMYKRARLGISYLPQEPSVFRKLTVEENIWSILETRRDLSKEQRKQKLEELIEEFQIGRIRKQQAYTLSGGERRRTEIARSLAIEPKFLLLDEPFAGIDPIAVADIKQIIKQLAQRGIGVLITDHNVRDTLEITTRAIIISSGQIVIQGAKDQILQSQIAREIYLGKDFSM